MTTIVLVLTVLASVLTPTLASAEAKKPYDYFSGVQMAQIEVNGKVYETPLSSHGDADRPSDIYMLKKSLQGDKVAHEMFMGGKDVRWLFIGKEKPLWIKATKSSIEVVDPTKEN